MIVKSILDKFILIISLLILLFIVPQTTTRENFIFKKFYNSGFFSNFSQVEFTISLINWVLILLFFTCTFLLSMA